MARLYSDEDFSFPVVEELRKLGHDVLTAEAGQSNKGISDSLVLAFAISATGGADVQPPSLHQAAPCRSTPASWSAHEITTWRTWPFASTKPFPAVELGKPVVANQ